MTDMSKRAGFIAAMAIIVAAASMGARAQSPQAGPGGPGLGRRGGPGGPMRGGPGGPAGAIDLPLGQLNLTAQQRDQVKSILDSQQDDLKTLAQSEMTAREALQQAIAAIPVDDNTIRQQSANLAAVEADMAVMRAHLRAQVWQLLTPDQQKLATSLEAQHPMPGRGRGK